MTRTKAARVRRRPHVRPLGWVVATALVAITLLPVAMVEGVAASQGTPTPVAAGEAEVEVDPTPTPTPQATPTPTPSPTPAATPTPQPTPTPTPAPIPTTPVGYWEGTVVLADETETRVAISLEACATPGVSCGEITLPEADGVGCSYDLQHVDPDDEDVFLPAEPPLADDQLVYEVGSSCVDCSDSWLDGTTIYLRPTSDGGIEVTPVMSLDLVPIFSLAPATRPAPQPTMDFSLDTTTLVRGQPLTVAVAGFLFAFVLIESDAGAAVPLGPVDLDETGSGTLVAPIPRDAPLGPATLLAEGAGRDHCEGGVQVRVTIVSGPGIDTALPTPPATDTVVGDAAFGSDAWRILFVGFAALVAGVLVLGSHRAARSRR